MDHDKKWLVVQFESYDTNHLLERSLLAVSERKNVIHHPCTVRERRHGQEGKQVQEGNDNGGHKKTAENSASRASLETQVEPIRSPEATKLRASCPYAPVLF